MAQRAEISQFHWKKSSEGTWKRQIDECEDFYRLYTKEDHGCYPIIACASFHIKSSVAHEYNFVVKSLRDAWAFLRYKHPTLGSRIERDTKTDTWKRVYTPFESKEDVDRWLHSTFKITHINTSALKWFNDNARPFEIPNIYVIKSDTEIPRQEVFLRCPHDITDGVGIIQLVNQLFTKAAEIRSQHAEYQYPVPDEDLDIRLSPCLRVAASIPGQLSESQHQRFEKMQIENGRTYTHPGLLSLPPSSSPAIQADFRTKRIAITIPRAVSSQILAHCKEVAPGVSVTHVFVSALAMALSECQPRKKEAYPVRYVDRPMLNLRPFCSSPYNSPDHAGAAYHGVCAQALGIDLEVPSMTDDEAKPSPLPRLATQVRDFYNQLKPTLSNETHEQVLLAPLTFKSLSPPPGADPWAVSDPPFCPVSLSSIGNLASIVASSNEILELTNVWIASQPIGAGVALFLGTWDGKIELSGVFNTQYHSEDYVQKFLEGITKNVYNGLDIDEEQF
ncbi:hypothetical protein F53441_10810 [Fusarium austroafricanum]|uniref:Uncharacterized protein n=1 Tax=Fusarium austroafricanum TaxID=2364996 RepID=A0A8H4K9Y6_9HYPO|nr:hypothetical protein F53441_10810 [Fusarium austroafricanum]